MTLGAQYEFKEYTYFGVMVKDIQNGMEIVNGSGDVTLTGDERSIRMQTSLISDVSTMIMMDVICWN